MLRVSFQIEINPVNQGWAMAEHWLEKIVERIKIEDHTIAEKIAEESRRAALLSHKGPIFWRSFGDVLGALIGDMNELFKDDVTKGTLNFSANQPQNGFSIHKSAYPCVSFQATPNFTPNTITQFTYSSVNPFSPKQLPGQGVSKIPLQHIPCRFDLEHDEVVMHLNGHVFRAPEHAAKFIIETLFTLTPYEQR